MRFVELLQRLPRNDAVPEVVAPQRALTTEALAPTGYVEPTFDEFDWPDDSAVLLIEAAGAVGKSVAAEALAAELKWPLVRAENAHVGSYSLSGLIQDAFGFGSDYIGRIARGDAGVIVDSLDEAHLRSGTQNFLAFLENVRNVSGSANSAASSRPRMPSIVVLSRSDTADLIRLYFADQGLPLATTRLAFFDRLGSNRFIECYMKARHDETGSPEYNAPLASPGPFGRLRDERFRQVMQILLRRQNVDLGADWAASSDFLGYAPVLIALAESLAVTNPAAERSSLALARSNNENDLLNDIAERILERERQKVCTNLSAKLQALIPVSSSAVLDEENLYSPLEQITRLAEMTLGVPIAAPLPATLPTAVRDVYEQAVKGFLADHPFVKGKQFASAVFGDYTKALVVGNVSAKASLEHDPVKSLGEVGPFFLPFYKRFTAGNSDAAVPESLIGDLLESWNLEAGLRAGAVSYALVELTADGGHVVFAYLSTPEGDAPPATVLRVGEMTGAFHLRRVRGGVSVITDQGVILGERNEPLLFGHHAFIAASEVSIEAEALSVSRGAESQAVAIAADTLTAHYLTQVDASPSSLKIFVPDPPPRLMGFKSELRSGNRSVPFSHYTGLKSILTAFRANVHMGLSVSRDFLDRIVSKDEPARQPIIDRLLELGVIVEDANWYRLETKALDSVGFSLSAIKDGQPSAAVLTFLASCGGPTTSR